MTEITGKDGSKLRAFPRPPSGFDPLSAAPAELEHYGFPPRRSERRALEQYRRIWRRLKDKYQYVEPTQGPHLNSVAASRKPTFGPNNVNWSGGVVLAPANQSFCGIQAELVVPNVYPPLQNQG